MRLYRADDGGIRLDLAPAGGAWDPCVLLAETAPAVVFNWVPLALDDQQAKQLQQELIAHIARYQRPTANTTHLLGLFPTPARI